MNILTAMLVLNLTAGALVQEEQLVNLSPEHRKWLEEEVVYIITDVEKELFLELETLEEKQRFIDAFWRKRDPNSATPVNEFKEEHYERLEYANKFLGRDTFLPGWKTDQGRYHIILGKPREVQRFEGRSDLVPCELWFYAGDTDKGLPAYFYLLFFKRAIVGEYKLYHPLGDGPASLLSGQYGMMSYGSQDEMREVMDVLERISPELADASLSFDLGSPPDYMTGRASLSTDTMLGKIDESPKRAIRTDYIDAWRQYGRKVSAEYSFNFIPSRNIFSVLYGQEKTPFVHYSIEIEPQNFSMESEADRAKYYTTLDISVEVTDSEENLVVSRDKEIYLQMTPGQLQQVGASPFSYQDDFPLIPGDYNVSVILRNRVSRQYTVAERDIRVPRISEGEPVLSDIILGFRTELKGDEIGPGELRTYQIGNLQVQPAAENLFILGDTVHVFLQAEGVASDYGLHFSLLNGDEVLQEKLTVMEDYQGGPVLERFHLTQMMGGQYELKVRLLDPSDNVVAERSAPIQLSPRSEIARPWIYRVSFNSNTPGILALARGDQLWRINKYGTAQKEFEKAFEQSQGELPLARWKLAEAYIRNSDADSALEKMLLPIESRFPQQYEVVAGIGFAHYIKSNFEKAAVYLDRAMQLRPAGTTLLNALGESYLKLGQVEKAKTLLERSLSMDPNQESAKNFLASIESKKDEQ